MPLTIPDEWLSEAGISPHDARVEFACRLYDGGRLSFRQAIRWSGLSRTGFEAAIIERGLALYHPTAEELESDLETLARLGGDA